MDREVTRRRPRLDVAALVCATTLVSATALVSAAACRRPEATSPPEAPSVQTSSTSPWRLVRSGVSPVFAALEGRAKLAVEPAYDEAIRRLPGVTLGSDEGTRAAVIGGLLAPLVAPLGSDRAFRVEADARGASVALRFEALDGASSFQLAVATGTAGRARIAATGAYVLLLPADRTEVRATVRGTPSAAFRVDADAAPGVQALLGDRIEIRSSRAGVVTVETSCARPHVVTPIHRGSTSVFLLVLGPLPREDDPLFSPGREALASDAARETCSSTTTATITAPWAPRAHGPPA